ncbi:MAG: OmpA family protein, partial [Alphaproteobacteria bacterium]|nr:OmpA family protein [Alphaproteobacteria bacterium]
SGLYKYASTGITTGAYTSLSRALTDTEGADAAAWNAQKEDSAKKLKTGVIAAGAGIVGGMVGNYLINRNYKKTELQKKIDKVVEEVEEIAPEYVIPEFNAPVYERPQLEMPEPQLDTSGLRSQLPEIMSVHPRHLNLSGDSTFASGKSDIKDPTAIEALIARLTDTVSMLTDEQKVCIKITGHTDRTQYAKGSKMTNQKLSEQRAQSVQDYLKRGLADYGDKIIYEPVTGEADKQCTKDLYPKNNDPKCRRVDIEIQDCSVPTDQ